MFYFFPFVFGVFLIIYIFPVFVFANTNVAAGSFRDKSRGTKHCKTNLNFMKHFIYILNLFRHSLTKFGQVGSRSHVKCLESDTLELKKGKVKSLIAKSRYFLNHFVSSVKIWVFFLDFFSQRIFLYMNLGLGGFCVQTTEL